MVVSSSMTRSSTPVMIAKSRITSMPSWLVITVWCAAPAVSHAVAEVRKSGAGFQTALPTGSFGIGFGTAPLSTPPAPRRLRPGLRQRDVLDHVGHQPEAVAHVAQGDHQGRAGVGREDQAHRVV